MSHFWVHLHINQKKRITIFDKFFMLAAIAYPLSSFPQIANVFSGNVEGVSLWTWGMFMFFSILFIIYGSIHKIKPILISNSLWLLMQGLVVVGVLVNKI